MKTIIHIIDSLSRGGAETLLIQIVKNMDCYRHIVVTLSGDIGFSDFELKGIRHEILGFRNSASYPSVILKLRKLISKEKPYLVHVHLPLSSFIARLACPRNIPLFISIHNNYSDSLKKVSKKLFILEKLLHGKREKLIFVSNAIKQDYENIIGVKGKYYILPNFISDKYFLNYKESIHSKHSEPFKLVSVGNLKSQKNYKLLIQAFSFLNRSDYTLDIYGEGSERMGLISLINEFKLDNVTLKGSVPEIDQHLKSYDAFILASTYEGFGLAPIEAAATGLPLLLSDISVFREVTNGEASFFNPNDAFDISEKISEMAHNYAAKHQKSDRLRAFIMDNYTMSKYINKLSDIYKIRN